MKPLILLGGGAREAAKDIIAYAERWNVPMETTWNAVDLVPYDHPLFVGRPGIVATRGANKAIQSCDYLLAIGARLDEPTIAYNYDRFAPNAHKVLVNVDIAESLKIPNLDYYYHQTAVEFMRTWSKTVPNEPVSPEWVKQCAVWKQDRLEGNTVSFWLMDYLSDTLPNDAILVIGSGCMAVNIFCAGFRNKAGQRFIQSSCGLGSMGVALPVAIGAALASGKPVTCVEGDGSFMQNIQELQVVKQLGLLITFYITSNKGYASIRNSETRAFGRASGRETMPDIAKVAEAFGVPVNIVDIQEDELPIPRVMFDGRGRMEDMWPYA
jgi:acetolactate synthase-1/2/3 large subunit